MLSVLISDDNLEVVKEVFNGISQTISDIQIIGIGTTGRETINYLETYKPSIVIKWSINKLIDRMCFNTDLKFLENYFHVQDSKKPGAKLLIDTIKNKYL